VASVNANLLDDAVTRGRSAWPAIAITRVRFVAYVLARAGDDADALRRLHAADLYLACGCAHGDPAAVAAFDRDYIGALGATLARVGARGAQADEVKQALRAQMLVAPAGGVPAIASYTGRGDLHGWLRISAAREAIRLLRRDARAAPFDDDVLAARSLQIDVELDHLKRTYRAEFRDAFRDALCGLDERERNLLRHRFCDGLNVEQIGAIYRVHRATAARWVAAAQSSLARATRRSLRDRLHVDAREVSSILRLIESRLEVTFK